MLNRALAVGLLALAALPAGAATVAARTGIPTTGIGPDFAGSGMTGAETSFTTTGPFFAPSISVNVCSTSPGTTPGGDSATVWLITGSGGSATIVAGPFSITGVSNVCDIVHTVTFTTPNSVTLAAASTTYSVVIGSMSAHFAWEATTGAATEAPGPSSYSADFYTTGISTPAGTPFPNPLSNGGSGHILLYAVAATAGTPPPTSVPTLSAWALAGLAMLLFSLGFLMLREARQQS